jgi:hypothetical protein
VNETANLIWTLEAYDRGTDRFEATFSLNGLTTAEVREMIEGVDPDDPMYDVYRIDSFELIEWIKKR